MKTFGVTDYTNLVPLKCCGRTDGRTDRRTDGRTDGRSGPTTRPAFAKATQVISVFPVTGLKILGNGRHMFFFWKKIYNFMHFERHFAFQKCIKLIFFPENLKKSRFHQ